MEKIDGPALGRQMIAAVRGLVARSLAALAPRFDALEAAVKDFPKQGDKGDRGDVGPVGPTGDQGEPGLDGESIKGEPGAPGKDGASIHPDTVALMVADQVAKAVASIPRAQNGKDGAPGRDALELSILPGIDESRSYPAGTWAKHNGGEIRAARATDPVQEGDILAAGWEVMREGVAGIVVTQGDDPREITVAAMLTGGTRAITSFEIPMVIDRGVWREGEFQKGDHVSWDGSGWIAQRKTSAKPGDEFDKKADKDWRLSTKRGQAGKDATPREAPKAGPVRLK